MFARLLLSFIMFNGSPDSVPLSKIIAANVGSANLLLVHFLIIVSMVFGKTISSESIITVTSPLIWLKALFNAACFP